MKRIIVSVIVLAAAFLIGFISYYKQTNKLSSGFDYTKKGATSLKVASFISPHHLVAKDLIEDVFRKVSEENQNVPVESIVLISPDHRNAGRGWVAVSGETRNIGGEEFQTNEDLVNFLTKEKLAYRQDYAFHGEHGIENLLPYAKKYFPEAKITALMIKDGYPDGKAKILAEKLAGFNPEKTVMILSADFSHYIGKAAADMHDEKSIGIISSFDYGSIKNMDIDCRGGLMTLLEFSKEQGFENFNLLANSSSSEIYQHDLGAENTSYITGFFSFGEKSGQEKTADILFADGNGIMSEKNIERLFWSQDENIFDFNGRYDEKIIQGKSIIFLSSDIFGNNLLEMSEKIKELKTKNNHVVAYYDQKPKGNILDKSDFQDGAHLLVDAGADLVIGYNSSMTGQIEIYKNKAIFYALGRFSGKNEEIIALGSSFSNKGITYFLIPLLKNEDGKIMIMSEEKKKGFLQKISGTFLLDKQVKNDILNGEISLYHK